MVIRSVDADPPWLTNNPLSQPHLLSQLPPPGPSPLLTLSFSSEDLENLKGFNYRQVIPNPTTLIRTLNPRMTEVHPDLHQAGIQLTTLLKATLSSWQLATL